MAGAGGSRLDGAYVALQLGDSGLEGEEKNRSTNIWRKWKQLSRFQRSLLYMLFIIVSFTLIYIYCNPKHSGRVGKENTSELPSKNKLNQFSKVSDSKGMFGLIEEPSETDHKFGIDKEEHNVAKEDKDEDDDDDPEDEPLGDNDGGDSNDAEEDKNENDLIMKAVPPPDGSVKFGGPQNERQRAVVESFQHAWQGYRTYAWGKDHLKPISKTHQTWFNLGLTLIDSLDTMLVMNLKEEFTEAKKWVSENLNFNINKDVNLFETTIRVLGGLLSTYHLSKDRVFLDKAIDLADRLLTSFDTPSGVPFSDVNLKTKTGHAPKWSPDSSTSEVTTIQLEFRDLSRATGNPKYEEAIAKVSRHVHNLPKTEGLVPIFINANTGNFRQYSTITLGARGDSYYEYLLKQWVQTGKTIDYLKQDYNASIDGVLNKLVRRTSPNNLLFIGEILGGGKDFKPKMDELVCFLAGTLALGHHNGLPKEHLTLAQELAYTCYLTFARQPTFLAPEISYFNTESGSTKDFYVKPNDAHYLLRPETVESLWYLYYFSGNKTYQDWGWQIFQGIETYCKVSGGYTTISNVRNPMDTRPRDMMESFFLGETLKYLYLLFADKQEMDLDQWVFNTEAHPLPIYPD